MARDSWKVSATAVAAFSTVATTPLPGRAFFRAAASLATRVLPLRFVRARADVPALAAVFRAFAISASLADSGADKSLQRFNCQRPGTVPAYLAAVGYCFGTTALDRPLPVSVSMKAMMSCRSWSVSWIGCISGERLGRSMPPFS